MKTYTNKSNAARAAKNANSGTLDGMQLQGEEGAWYYARKPALQPPAAEQRKRTSNATPREGAYDAVNGATQGRISGYRIDSHRDEQHGIKRRSAGTIGGRLWALFDDMLTAVDGAQDVLIADVKAHPRIQPFNANKVVIEFYQWRKFHGVRGRGKKQKVDA